MILSAIGVALLVAIGFWVFGGFALRLGGALLVVAGAVGLAAAGDANGLLLIALGSLAWWTGHVHYRLRRGAWKSALASRIATARTRPPADRVCRWRSNRPHRRPDRWSRSPRPRH
jgi:hypothetical protein